MGIPLDDFSKLENWWNQLSKADKFVAKLTGEEKEQIRRLPMKRKKSYKQAVLDCIRRKDKLWGIDPNSDEGKAWKRGYRIRCQRRELITILQKRPTRARRTYKHAYS